MKPLGHRSLFVPIVAGLITLAWVTLWVWERSPYGRYLSHTELEHIDLADGLNSVMLQAGLYVAAWMLMTVAMMLPTTLPLIEIFRRLTSQRLDRIQLLLLIITGYLSVWLAFGVSAHLFDLGLHGIFHRSSWLQATIWVLGAGPLLAAGAFQFSRLKYRCLDKCRAPLSFVVQHWRGRDSRAQAFVLGAHHGIFCVGCCWALMLLMFAVGSGNVGWMLALGTVMAIEKNMSWGRKLSRPLGTALIAWGALIVFSHSWLWQT
jgi:predicted metal-binding membrane protein